MSTRTRSATPTLVAGAVLLALVAVLLVWQRPWAGDDSSAAADGAEVDAQLRQQLAEASDASDESAWTAGFGPGGADVAASSWQARQALGVDDVRLTLVSVGDAPDRSDGSRSAVVKVTWSVADDAALGPAPEATSTVALRVRSASGGEAVDLLDFDPRGDVTEIDPLPLWLAGEVAVSDTPGSGAVSFVTVGGEPGVPAIPDAAAFVAAGEAQVARITGDSGPAAVLVPDSGAEAAALLGREPDALGPVAGVTTSLPGIGVPVVVLNPAEFDRMDARGGQLVVTHELTHAATGTVGSTAEPWLVEGFADWVALRDDTSSLATSASALLLQVGDSGAPAALPTAEDLAGPTSGAAYQGAWLAVVVLAQEHGGDAAVLQVYRAALTGTPIEQALEAVGTSVSELTTQWQDYLTYSASTVS